MVLVDNILLILALICVVFGKYLDIIYIDNDDNVYLLYII